MERDQQIDYIRGLAMIQVILVHILYWNGLFSQENQMVAKSFLLFEMPLFFFVIGAVNKDKIINKPLKFIVHRISRVLIPYWIYALINIMYIIIRNGLNGTLSPIYVVHVSCSWIIPLDRQYASFPFSTGAMWFVPVYILCVILIPGLITLHRSKFQKLEFPILIALIFVFQWLHIGILQKVCFYTLWMCLGLHYDSIRINFTSKSKIYIGIIAGCGIILLIMHFFGVSINMQNNKFPPNGVFLVFSIGAVTAVLKLLFCCSIKIERLHHVKVLKFILEEYEKHSMSIFLYHTLVFSVVVSLINKIRGILGECDLVYFLLYLIILVPGCAIVGKLFSRFENISPRILQNK